MQVEARNSENTVGLVLLHGAGLGSWIWQKVEPRLTFPCLAVDLPGRAGNTADLRNLTLDEVADAIREQINQAGFTRFALVAHSVSGPLALKLASQQKSDIESVVLIGAGVPDTGSSYIDCLPLFPRFFLKGLYKLKPGGALPPKSIVLKALCNGLSNEDSSMVIDKMVTEAPCLFLDPVAWHQPRRSVYMKLTNDRSDLSPALQDQMAARLGEAPVIEIASGHLPMLSHAEQVAEVLNAEAKFLSSQEAGR